MMVVRFQPGVKKKLFTVPYTMDMDVQVLQVSDSVSGEPIRMVVRFQPAVKKNLVIAPYIMDMDVQVLRVSDLVTGEPMRMVVRFLPAVKKNLLIAPYVMDMDVQVVTIRQPLLDWLPCKVWTMTSRCVEAYSDFAPPYNGCSNNSPMFTWSRNLRILKQRTLF